MFYVKHDLEFSTVETVIHADNVYTICPGCGTEHQIDLAEIPELCLESTAVYCASCSARRKEKEKTPTGGNR